MKLRVMGTLDECRQAQDFYKRLRLQSNVRYVSVSEPYPNRGSVGLYRVYIEIEYKDGSNLYAEPNVRDSESKTTLPDRMGTKAVTA